MLAYYEDSPLEKKVSNFPCYGCRWSKIGNWLRKLIFLTIKS